MGEHAFDDPFGLHRLDLHDGDAAALQVGCRVIIQGLITDQFNGRTGVCEAFNGERGRWVVAVDAAGASPSEKKAFHPSNLKRMHNPIPQQRQQHQQAHAAREGSPPQRQQPQPAQQTYPSAFFMPEPQNVGTRDSFPPPSPFSSPARYTAAGKHVVSALRLAASNFNHFIAAARSTHIQAQTPNFPNPQPGPCSRHP